MTIRYFIIMKCVPGGNMPMFIQMKKKKKAKGTTARDKNDNDNNSNMEN